MGTKEEPVIICYGCLSADRNVTPLGELSGLFNILRPQTCMNEDVQLCWECRSILKKTWRFQQRIQQAQLLLQTPQLLINYRTSSLSTLQSKIIDSKYDIIHVNYKENEGQLELKIEQELDENLDLDDKIHEDFSDDEIKDLKEVTEIKDEGIEHLMKNTKIEIEIEQLNVTIDSDVDNKINDDSSEEEIKEFNVEIKDDKKSIKRNVRPTKCRYEKNDLSTRIEKLDEFYVKTNLNYEVLKEVMERRLSLKSNLKLRYFCKICQMGFRLAIDLRRHETVLHLPINGPYKCCECDVKNTGRLNTVSELQQHFTTHSIYKCCLCPDVFKTEAYVIRHIKVVHRYQYRCLECREYFYTYSEMVQHYDKMHPQFTCDQCGATCRSKKAIESHIKFRHLPSACDVCGRLCSSGTAVDSHKRLHHPKKRNSVTELSYCVECNMQFDNVYKYKKHLYHAVAHRPRVPIKVPCPDCGKIFSSKRSSNNHYNLVHLKKTKHYCEICDKYFARSCALRKHRQRVHERKHPSKNKIRHMEEVKKKLN